MTQNSPTFKAKELAAPAYQVNPNVKLPSWVKCMECGKGPTAEDWLKPIHPDEKDCRHLIHLSHIPNAPELSAEAGWIARNA